MNGNDSNGICTWFYDFQSVTRPRGIAANVPHEVLQDYAVCYSLFISMQSSKSQFLVISCGVKSCSVSWYHTWFYIVLHVGSVAPSSFEDSQFNVSPVELLRMHGTKRPHVRCFLALKGGRSTKLKLTQRCHVRRYRGR